LFVAFTAGNAGIFTQLNMEKGKFIQVTRNPGNRASNFVVLVHLSDFPVRAHAHHDFHDQTHRAKPPAKHLAKNDPEYNTCQEYIPK